jgi:hypothetical protein
MDIIEEVAHKTQQILMTAYGPRENWDSKIELLFQEVNHIILNLLQGP